MLSVLLRNIVEQGEQKGVHFQRVYETDTLVSRRSLRGSVPADQLRREFVGTGGMVLEFRSHSVNAWGVGDLRFRINGQEVRSERPFELMPGFRGIIQVSVLELAIEVDEYLTP